MNKIMTLVEFFDSNEIPNKEQSLGKRRVSLPQIHTDDFISDLDASKSIPYHYDSTDPKSLIPTQSQFNDGKVKSIIMGVRSGNDQKPIIVSNDNYIVDGHHRWAAHSNIGIPVPVIRVGATISDILQYLKDKPYVKNHTINESKIVESVNIDNMKRQLIDILRTRIQKSAPGSSVAFSKMLDVETKNIIAMNDVDTEKEYNDIMINNKIEAM